MYRDGIQVQDAHGNILGSSQLAGSQAIQQVAISRIVTSAPALFIPGLIMAQLESTKLLKAYPRLSMPLNLLTVTGSLLVALPCAIALFPQIAQVDAKTLEPRFWGLKDSLGNPIDKIYFNRGL